MEKSYEVLRGIEHHLEHLCSSVDKLFLLLQSNQTQDNSRRGTTVTFNTPTAEQKNTSLKSLRNGSNEDPDNGISKNNE